MLDFNADFEEQNMAFDPEFGQTLKGDPGTPGFSPVCTVRRNSANTGTTISIQDEDGTETADVYDGQGAQILSIEEIDEILGW